MTTIATSVVGLYKNDIGLYLKNRFIQATVLLPGCVIVILPVGQRSNRFLHMARYEHTTAHRVFSLPLLSLRPQRKDSCMQGNQQLKMEEAKKVNRSS